MKKGFPALLLLAFLIGVMAAPPAFAQQIQRIEVSGNNIYAHTDHGVVSILGVVGGISVDGFRIVTRKLPSTDASTRIELIVGYPGQEVASEFVLGTAGEFVSASNIEALGATLAAFQASPAGVTLAGIRAAMSSSPRMEAYPHRSCFLCTLQVAAAIAAIAFLCAPPAVLTPPGAGACALAWGFYFQTLNDCAGACAPPGPLEPGHDPGTPLVQ